MSVQSCLRSEQASCAPHCQMWGAQVLGQLQGWTVPDVSEQPSEL